MLEPRYQVRRPIQVQTAVQNQEDISDEMKAGATERMPLYEAVLCGGFTDGEVRSLAGNGMCVPVVGAVMLFVLSCTSPRR